MALATRCPACETVFRITTAQAAAKSGMVRCGECRHAFNSLDALVRVEDLDLLDAPQAVQPAAVAAPGAPTGSGASDTTRVVIDLPEVAHDDALADEFLEELASPHHETVMAAFEPADEAPEPQPPREWWLPAEGEVVLPPSMAPTPVEPEPEPALADRRLDLEWQKELGGTGPEFMRNEPALRVRRSRTERVILGVLSGLALLALLAQAAYHWRDELAARWPASRAALVAACGPLHCRVEPPAHPDAVTIESTGVNTSAPDSDLYVLTALLRNRDDVAVRYPSLMLTLTNTQDQAVLRRILRPEDYLPADRPAAAGFTAGSELPVRVTFELNELRFVGYRLDRFYP